MLEAKSDYTLWRYNHKCQIMSTGKVLRIELLSPATVRWSVNNWETASDVPTRDTGLGIHTADIPSGALASGTKIVFTFHWTESDQWERQDYTVTIE